MNPERTFTLPPYQTAAGVVDIIMHTLERYFSHDDDMTVTDSIAESLIRTVQDSAFKVLQQPDNYLHRAQIMWASSLSHNGLTGCGTTSDWATHFLDGAVGRVTSTLKIPPVSHNLLSMPWEYETTSSRQKKQLWPVSKHWNASSGPSACLPAYTNSSDAKSQTRKFAKCPVNAVMTIPILSAASKY